MDRFQMTNFSGAGWAMLQLVGGMTLKLMKDKEGKKEAWV